MGADRAAGLKWLHLVVTVIGAIIGTVAFANWVILRLSCARYVF
jgi:hypothetical protein